MTLHIGFRLNPRTDQDIIEAISNAKNTSRAIKHLIRMGLNNQAYKTSSDAKSVTALNNQPRKITVVIANEETTEEEITNNLLAGF